MRKVLLFALWCLALISWSDGIAKDSGEYASVTAKPKFEVHPYYTSLVVVDGNQTYEVPWSRTDRGTIYPCKLDPQQTYTFIFRKTPDYQSPDERLRKIKQGSAVLYDEEICEVHKIRMKEKEVPIEYGQPMLNPNAPSWQTTRKLFPHHRDSVSGGCCVTEQKTTHLLICPECEAAYEKWTKEHPKKESVENS